MFCRKLETFEKLLSKGLISTAPTDTDASHFRSQNHKITSWENQNITSPSQEVKYYKVIYLVMELFLFFEVKKCS